jgi:hypothetical protein
VAAARSRVAEASSEAIRREEISREFSLEFAIYARRSGSVRPREAPATRGVGGSFGATYIGATLYRWGRLGRAKARPRTPAGEIRHWSIRALKRVRDLNELEP